MKPTPDTLVKIMDLVILVGVPVALLTDPTVNMRKRVKDKRNASHNPGL